MSNTGWMIKPEYSTDVLASDLTNWLNWSYENSVAAFNNNVVGCAPAADHCTIPAGQQWPQLTPVGYGTVGANGLTSYRRPATPTTVSNVTATYTAGRVSTVVANGVSTSYTYADSAGIRTTTRTNAAGYEEYRFEISTGLLKRYRNAVGAVTLYEHSPSRLVSRITYPELNYIEFTRDSRGNVTQTRAVPKPGSANPPIVLTAEYPTNCTNNVACNRPTWTRDANLHQTDYTYHSVHGSVLTVTSPAGPNGVRPQIRYGYTTLPANGSSSIVRLTSISTCRTLATCAGTADETRTTISYGTVAANGLQIQSVTTASGDGLLAATSSTTYTPAGDLATINGPLAGDADTSRRIYDSATRRLLGEITPDPDGTGILPNRAVRMTYNANGQVTLAEEGITSDQSDTAWSGFTSLAAVVTTYDDHSRPTRQSQTAPGTTYSVAQFSYDGLGRLDCVAERMDKAQWASQANVCTPQLTGPNGSDRVSRRTYDAAGRVLTTQTALGTPAASTEAATYTLNGQLSTVTDAENNRTTYRYDGHDRLIETRLPSATQGDLASSSTNTRGYVYDLAGNLTSLLVRGNATIDYDYDALGRMVSKTRDGSGGIATFAYDNAGRVTSATDASTTHTFTYDALGREIAETGPFGALTSAYDLAGRRTRLTHPDGYFVTYTYLVTGETHQVRENDATSGVGLLASYTYDNRGQRTVLTRGNGTRTVYEADGASRLTEIEHNLAATANDVKLGFSHNPAGQIVSNTRSNDAYSWNGHYNVTRNYSANGLNQYTASGAIVPTYDSRGNLRSAGSTIYTYDFENRLVGTSDGVALTYDPLSRLNRLTSGTTDTRFTYDGTELVGEYDANNVLIRRYVHGPGSDEPLVWYEGSGTTDRRFFHADERGSIIALSNNIGTGIAINAYDEYGIPETSNAARFQYTGQIWLPELGMYNYKARIYSPSLGRFLQTDPIGYSDGLNLYNYVGSDPVNSVDPSGTTGCPFGSEYCVITGTRLTSSLIPSFMLIASGYAAEQFRADLFAMTLAGFGRGGPPGPRTINPATAGPRRESRACRILRNNSESTQGILAGRITGNRHWDNAALLRGYQNYYQSNANQWRSLTSGPAQAGVAVAGALLGSTPWGRALSVPLREGARVGLAQGATISFNAFVRGQLEINEDKVTAIQHRLNYLDSQCRR